MGAGQAVSFLDKLSKRKAREGISPEGLHYVCMLGQGNPFRGTRHASTRLGACLARTTRFPGLISYNSFYSYAKGGLVPGGCVAIDTDTRTDTGSLLETFRQSMRMEAIDFTGAPGRN